MALKLLDNELVVLLKRIENMTATYAHSGCERAMGRQGW
jgi:hypothetical protein